MKVEVVCSRRHIRNLEIFSHDVIRTDILCDTVGHLLCSSNIYLIDYTGHNQLSSTKYVPGNCVCWRRQWKRRREYQPKVWRIITWYSSQNKFLHQTYFSDMTASLNIQLPRATFILFDSNNEIISNDSFIATATIFQQKWNLSYVQS